ncbi:MAG: hypothetical protein IGQ88_01840 [Gloeomargaritaceae cyanobacterium C42_A2020_066]|nr:hypothetical protein [Gloeomargaritaceae cyanobacterium C42_A2020_066]
MSDKHKFTVYLTPELHRQLKIRSVVDGLTQSALTQRAIEFFLAHPEVVLEMEERKSDYRVHHCPECDAPVILSHGDLRSLKTKFAPVIDEDLTLPIPERSEQLVTC